MTAPFLKLKPVPRQPLPRLSVYQIGHMRDIAAGQTVSWTFAPGSIKHQLREMIYDFKVATLEDIRLEGDTRVYQRVVLTDYGQQVLKEMDT